MRDCYDGGTCGNEELIEELTRQRDDLLKACKLGLRVIGRMDANDITDRPTYVTMVLSTAAQMRAAITQTKE